MGATCIESYLKKLRETLAGDHTGHTARLALQTLLEKYAAKDR